MGNLNNLAGLFNPKENKYVLEGANIKIGKGVLICESEILPLDAISFIETLQKGKRGYEKWPLILLAGFAMLFIPVTVIVFLGLFVLSVALVNIVNIYEENNKEIYYLRIQNHAGRYYYITTQEWDFLQEIRDAILTCMSDKSAMYSGKDRVMMVGGDYVTGDKITAAGDINIGSIGNSGTIGSGDVISGGGRKAGRDMVSETEGDVEITNFDPISDDEWETLKEFARVRMEDFSREERNFIICKNLAILAERKDSAKCQSLLKRAGKASLDIILSSATAAVKSIINRLILGL